MKKISPNIKIKIIELSCCFWYWKSFYLFYASILDISAYDLEKKYPKTIYNKYSATEAILDLIKNDEKKIIEVVKAFYELDKPFEKEDNNKYIEATKKLADFKKSVKKYIQNLQATDRVDSQEIEKIRKENSIEREKTKILDAICTEFYQRANQNTMEQKQQRGFWLEKIFYEILELENIEHTKSYKTKSEQIDGHFKFKSFDYLVEIKWTEDRVKQKDVDIFLGKIKKKAQSNRGCILSMSGFDESAIEASKTDRNLIFIDATKFISIIERRITFYDVMKDAEDTLVRHGLPCK
ncbi:MAG: restriction endonuclease [Candidatus Pacebacteria bacterium]|nr:restriction endonuclease [Candidatus Paceibacterota bacterium]